MRKTHRLLLAVVAIATPALAGDLTIIQKDQTFSVSSLTLQTGDVLTFKNMDSIVHNIAVHAAGDDDITDLGNQKPGEQVVHTFDKAGFYRVVCNIHPRMKMIVNVK